MDENDRIFIIVLACCLFVIVALLIYSAELVMVHEDLCIEFIGNNVSFYDYELTFFGDLKYCHYIEDGIVKIIAYKE